MYNSNIIDKLKLPPQNIEAEKYVLGSILIDEEAVFKIAPILKAEQFYDQKNKNIYTAIVSLFEKRSPVDILLVDNEIKALDLGKKGYKSYLTELASLVPTSANVEEYAELVKDASIRRKLVTAGSSITELAYSNKDTKDVLNLSEKEIFEIAQSGQERDFVHISELLLSHYEKAEELAKHKGEFRGIKTGFKTLDGMLGGFQNSDLVILGARPSVGKTAFSLDLARHISVYEKKKVAFFALEMSADQLLQRVISMQTGIGLWDMRTGNYKNSHIDKIADTMGMLSECDLYIDDTPGVNIFEVRTKARRLKLEKGLDIIFIDYLQLIQGNNKENRVQEVSEITRQLKIIARELDVPVIALSQLNRGSTMRNDHKPQLADLRESGSIEQDADIVMFIHREELYKPDDPNIKGIAELIIAKHRNGPTGEIKLQFVPEQARYRESK